MIFELSDISHFYGAHQALSRVSVGVKPGTVGLLGPNGAGKTTLIKTVLGLISPYAGEGTVLGHNIRTHSIDIRRRVGYMPEREAVYADLTGLESVSLMARLCGLPRDQAMRRAHEVLDCAGVEEQRYRACGEYSTGMKQRIKLAQALVHGPELVFLDEPTNGLDPKGRTDMLELISCLNKQGTSVVLSTHLLNDVEAVCDDVLVLVKGEVRHYGPLGELTQGQSGKYEVQVKRDGHLLLKQLEENGFKAEVSDNSPEHLLVELAADRIIDFWKHVVSAQVQVRLFAPTRLSLEHAFVKLIDES